MAPIPTKSRTAISRKVGYPVGAELISEALDGVPQYERLTLNFSAGWTSNIDQQLEQHIQSGRPLRVLYITYSYMPPSLSASNASIEAGYYDQKWEVWIEAVPVKYKAAVGELLKNKVLPQIKQWLATPRGGDWGRGGKALDFFVLLPQLELTCAERSWN